MLRKATIRDAQHIYALINSYAEKDIMLPRSLNEIYEHIRDFWVFEVAKKIIACCALHVVGWESLAEIKSLAVAKRNQKKGIGRTIVEQCIQEAKELNVKTVFALTYAPQFFQKLGFKRTSKASLPHKIWSECYKCSKFPNCTEIALLKHI